MRLKQSHHMDISIVESDLRKYKDLCTEYENKLAMLSTDNERYNI